MTITTNSNSLSIPVTLGTGKYISMNVMPNEVFFDQNGVIWLFSMRFDSGEIGNFFLQRKNSTKKQVLDFVKEHLVPLGLEITGNKIREKYQTSDRLPEINLALFLANKYGPSVIENIVDRIGRQFIPSEWGYYELASGEFVIAHPVRLELA